MTDTRNRSPYESVLAVLVLLLLGYYFFRYRFLIPVSLIFIFLSLLIPALARAVHFAWQWIAKAIGAVSGRILLGAVFFLVLTPLAWAFRLFSGNRIKGLKHAETQFVTRNHVFQKEDLEQLYSSADPH